MRRYSISVNADADFKYIQNVVALCGGVLQDGFEMIVTPCAYVVSEKEIGAKLRSVPWIISVLDITDL